jgi:hypothetical protein
LNLEQSAAPGLNMPCFKMVTVFKNYRGKPLKCSSFQIYKLLITEKCVLSYQKYLLISVNITKNTFFLSLFLTCSCRSALGLELESSSLWFTEFRSFFFPPTPDANFRLDILVSLTPKRATLDLE